MTHELAGITGPVSALLAGLVTSLHCAGMCGPLACSVMPARRDEADPHTVATVYHVTRLVGYSLLGALVGGMGRVPLSFIGLGGGRTRWVRPRIVVYFILLLVGTAVATYAFSTVKRANFLVYRMSGAAYFVSPGDVRNQFMVRLLNKRTEPATFVVSTEGVPAGVQQSGFTAPVTLGPLAESVSPLVLIVDRKHYTGPFHFTVRVEDSAHTYQLSRAVEFMGPEPKLLEEEDREKGVQR